MYRGEKETKDRGEGGMWFGGKEGPQDTFIDRLVFRGSGEQEEDGVAAPFYSSTPRQF